MTADDIAWLHELQDLDRYALNLLRRRGWGLLFSYGRLMHGPDSGMYVSALPTEVVVALLDALARGDELYVHLMHRHVSGNYESSMLRLVDGRLVMRFPDREELA